MRLVFFAVAFCSFFLLFGCSQPLAPMPLMSNVAWMCRMCMRVHPFNIHFWMRATYIDPTIHLRPDCAHIFMCAGWESWNIFCVRGCLMCWLWIYWERKLFKILKPHRIAIFMWSWSMLWDKSFSLTLYFSADCVCPSPHFCFVSKVKSY